MNNVLKNSIVLMLNFWEKKKRMQLNSLYECLKTKQLLYLFENWNFIHGKEKTVQCFPYKFEVRSTF